MARKARIERKTAETTIAVEIDLDGGQARFTGVLEAVAVEIVPDTVSDGGGLRRFDDGDMVFNLAVDMVYKAIDPRIKLD